jgi:DnaK suppressor protein
VAKQSAKKTTRKPAARNKSTARRRKLATTKKAVPKTVSRTATTSKAAKKTAGKPNRKRAKPRAANKVRKGSRKAVRKTTKAVRKTTKTVRKTTRRSTARVPAIAVAPKPAANVTPLEAPVKRRSHLKKRDLDQFRELLLSKRAQLVGDVSTLQQQALSENRREAAGDLSSMPIHMADLGTDNYEKEFTLGLIESERTLLREIDQALARIDDGTYGICEATGKPIGKVRLKAQPWVRFCYEYVLAQEEGRRSSGL